MSFQLIDKFVCFQTGKRAVASTTFSEDENYLAEHFPGFPVIPGNLLTESMAQTGGFLIAQSLNFEVFPVLIMVGQMKFRQFARAEEELNIEVKIESTSASIWEVSGKIRNTKTKIATGRLFFCPCSTENGPLPGEMVADLCRWHRQMFEVLTSGLDI